MQGVCDGAVLSVEISSPTMLLGAGKGEAGTTRRLSGELLSVVPVFGPSNTRGLPIAMAERDGSFHGQCTVASSAHRVRIEASLLGDALIGSPLLIEIGPSVLFETPSLILSTPELVQRFNSLLKTTAACGKLSPVLACNDDFAPAKFSAVMNGMERFLILIQSTESHVFGAYVHDKFGTEGGYSHVSSETFLFNLGQQPFRLSCDDGLRKGRGIHRNTDGLRLGGGYDLTAFSSARHYCNSGHTYKVVSCPADPSLVLAPGTLCGTPGNPNYTPSRMEVYLVRP